MQNCLYCLVPYSFFIFNFLKILKKNGFIQGFTFFIKSVNHVQKKRIFIVYLKNKSSLLNFNFNLVSSPSKKVYISLNNILKKNKKMNSEYFLISSNKGLFFSSNSKAGGEVLCNFI